MALHLVQASSITLRTFPYLFLRLLLYFLFGILFVLYGIAVYFIGGAVAAIHPYARFAVWIIALLLPFPLLRLAREYILYVIRAGHVAVISELVRNGRLPEGVGQIAFGREKVQGYFKQTSVLFVMDRLVIGVVSGINGMMMRVANLFQGIPGMRGLVKLAGLILSLSLTYVDEAILARNFLNEKESAWESAQKGLVLYAQIWREVLGTAVLLGLFSAASLPVFFILLIGPALGLAAAVGHAVPAGLFIAAAVIFSFVLKFALVDPWTLTNMIVTYLKETEGKVPDPEWEGKLETLSKKFCDIKRRAVEEALPRPAV